MTYSERPESHNYQLFFVSRSTIWEQTERLTEKVKMPGLCLVTHWGRVLGLHCHYVPTEHAA